MTRATVQSSIPLRELSLFSGYCGFTLGLRLAGLNIRTVGYVDHEPYIQKLIAQRIKDGFLDDAPIFGDVKLFLSEGYAASYQGLVDILTAGFPCQPHSTAGRRLGASDPRNLWPELAECIGVVRPRSVLLENVPGLIDGADPYVAVVLGDLARIGYDARWGLVPAAAVGAPHLRWRWWCLAYPADDGRRTRGWAAEQTGEHETLGRSQQPGTDGEAGLVADARCVGSERRGAPGYLASPQGASQEDREEWQRDGHPANDSSPAERAVDVADTVYGKQSERNCSQSCNCKCTPARGKALRNSISIRSGWWEVEPSLDRVVDGTPNRVDQLRAIGNGIVPAVVAEFLRRLA